MNIFTPNIPVLTQISSGRWDRQKYAQRAGLQKEWEGGSKMHFISKSKVITSRDFKKRDCS